ncbi:MAG: 4-hydroxy-tetrahydrodipicolinate synthase [Clostridiales bacterium]|nr:4-hydroxy-tetrahydrodipicolinate synthase [Clostridiales bacterium]
MKKPLFTGSSVAIVTPFKDGKVNFKKLGELIDFQITGGTASIVICGTTGESATQTLEEHADTVDFCIRHVNGRVPVIAGAGSNDTEAALYLCRSAEKSGADGLLVVTPYYNKATQKGLIRHYNYLADRVNIPIILYNVPGRTGIGFTVDTYYELSKHPNIIGVKEASADINLVTKTMALCGDELYFWSGDDSFGLPCMALGGKGIISVLANFLPRVMADLCDYCLSGDFENARKLNMQYIDLMSAMFYEVNPIPVKTAMNLLGMDVGELRMPLCEMEPANLEKLKNSMRKAALEIGVHTE